MTDEGADEALVFLEETAAAPAPRAPSWQVLLVDDEPDVHAATRLAFRGLLVQGRALEFTSAYSDAQARALLAQGGDFAVALVDVVMEREDAGLALVHHIREELGNRALRIILRTGQPGYAPEIDTIARYDINDYRTKAELTQTRLYTSLTMALRSYAQIRQLETGCNGLEHILAATAELSRPTGLEKFASGLATQLCALLAVGEQALVCAALQGAGHPPHVLAAAGPYQAWAGLPLAAVPDARVRQRLERTLAARRHALDDGISLFFQGRGDDALVAFIDVQQPLTDFKHRLLELFCSHVAVAFENLQLYLQINDQAYTDALVRLPNRNAMVQSIDAHAAAQDTVALVDLDAFSDINSVLDDSFGDAVLCAVARQLRAAFGPEVLVARLGSDLFGLYGPAQQVTADAVARVFAEPFQVEGGEPLRLSATTGLVRLQPGQDEAGAMVLKNAGAALKQAKRFARGKALFFEAAQADAARERIQLLNRLRASFSSERLFLHYQPQVELISGRCIGAEALLRWRTEDGTFVPPDRFIPLAEQSGLMVAIGEWVARTAMRWRAQMAPLVAQDFRVAINVSQMQFAEPDFAETFLALLDESGLQGAQVEIELTESVVIGGLEQLQAKLGRLRARGVRVAMDDFGTGYSSLSVLQRVRVDRLKIDRSFVSGVQCENISAEQFEIAMTILTMARHLQLTTIAEGIETPAQYEALAAAGCEEGQGYLFSRPLAPDDFTRWLQQRTAPPLAGR